MIGTIMVILSLAGLFLLVIVVRGPKIWDRILATNLFSSIVILLIMLYATAQNFAYLLDIVILYALLGFLSIVFIARFIQGRGKI